MDPVQQEVLDIFTRTRALLQGHFVLRSGLHSGHFFQCAQVCQYMDKVTRLIELLRPKLAAHPCDVVLAPVEAVDRDEAKARVLVVNRDHRLESRDVELGLESGDRVQVVRGIEPDDQLVVGNGARHLLLKRDA